LHQYGKPDAIYREPANMFVARFIGSPSMNLLRLRAGGVALTAADGKIRFPVGAGVKLPAGDVVMGVRPHHLRLAIREAQGIPVTVDLIEHLGRSNFVVCTPKVEGVLSDQRTLVFEADPQQRLEPGMALVLAPDLASVVYFDAANGQLLRATSPTELARRETASMR
jgi:multiple sugar transport system ATP-binding protein